MALISQFTNKVCLYERMAASLEFIVIKKCNGRIC